MSKWQSYKLVGSNDDPDDEEFGGGIGDDVGTGSSRRRLLEGRESFRAWGRYVDEKTQTLRQSVPAWAEPFMSRWTVVFVGAGILLLVVLVGFFFNIFGAGQEQEDILQYIDPLIGTGPGGHVFAGATLPFGMAKPVADVMGEHMGGFASDRTAIYGFSSLHDSGTGGSPSMGNFPLFLHPHCPNMTACSVTKYERSRHYLPETVNASVGYFTLELESGIRAEMAAGERASLFRFSFTNTSAVQNAVLLMDGSDLPGSQGPRSMAVNASTGRITAEGRFNPSFGQGTYKNYQCVDVRRVDIRNRDPRSVEVLDFGGFNDTVFEGMANISSTSDWNGPRQGVYLRYKNVTQTEQLYVRVGLSWLSIDRACENAVKEIDDWNFERLVKQARQAWTQKLKPITIDSTGVNRNHLRNYWSGVYRAFLSPQDYTGENPLWNSTEPYYDSWYCIWDTFRGVHPFYMLVDTVSQSRMVRALIDIYKHLGWLPDCRMSFCKGLTQGGSNADVILVDSFMKKLDGVNWTDAYAAVIKDAEVQPPNWDIEGRGGLKAWKTLGYIPYQDYTDPGGMHTRSISRTVEYAYNDFCIAEMANVTERSVDYVKYAKRANNWKNVYNPDTESMGFLGFPQPRWENGTFAEQNATLCSALNNFDSCYLNPSGHETYEGSPWTYLFYVPGDMQGLINLIGGREPYLARLEKLHDSGVLYMGDEQAFLTAFLYHYAGRPGLSAKKTHHYIPSMFNDTIEGIPGNDDSGSMGAFVFFSMLGIFPSAGQSVYFIIPPFFPSVSIKNPQTGKTATIRNVNFDASYQKMYIQSAKLNGQTYTKNWLDHSFFLEGGTLDLVLGETESSWGTREEDVPPSLSSTGIYYPI